MAKDYPTVIIEYDTVNIIDNTKENSIRYLILTGEE